MILWFYDSLIAFIRPSCFSSGPLILSLQDTYSHNCTPCKQEMIEWSQDSCWNTSLAPALRLFRTLGIFTNCGNISAGVIRHIFLYLPGCLAFCNGSSKPGLWLRRVKLKCCILRSSQPHEEITFLSLFILSSLLLWLNGNSFWVHLTTSLILWKERRWWDEPWGTWFISFTFGVSSGILELFQLPPLIFSSWCCCSKGQVLCLRRGAHRHLGFLRTLATCATLLKF